MKVDETLLILLEECLEVGKVICKAARFGMNDHHPRDEAEITNYEKLAQEIADAEVMLDLAKKHLRLDEERMQKLRENKIRSLETHSTISKHDLYKSDYYNA